MILTVEIVSPGERDKFRALSRPESYHKIRPHEAVGERGCYTVEMTEEEYDGPHVFAAAGGMAHTLYAEDGGTSSACAMATRVAAYALSSGLSASATKDQLASSARSTGAPASYEGNGVLELVGEEEPPASNTYWFPGDLDTYITLWPIGLASESRITATVLEGVSGASLRAVCSEDLSAMKGGDYEDFSLAIPADRRGFFVGDWKPLPDSTLGADEIYVGIIVEAPATTEIRGLMVGLAEAQIR